MTNVYFEEGNFDKEVHRKCKCGHDLYQHGFTQHISNMGYPHMVLWVSQCVMCDCKEFHQEENKK